MMRKRYDPIQEQLIEARKEQILDAAVHVFAEKGFHRAKMQDVADFAGIAVGTIYLYFKTKEAMLLGILDRLNESDERQEHFDWGAEIDLKAFFGQYMQQRLEVLFANEQVFKALLPEVIANPDVQARYNEQVIQPTYVIAEQFFEAQRAKGAIRDVDVPLMLRALAGMVLGLLVLRMLGDETLQERWQELPDVVTELILNGLVAKEDEDGNHNNSR